MQFACFIMIGVIFLKVVLRHAREHTYQVFAMVRRLSSHLRHHTYDETIRYIKKKKTFTKRLIKCTTRMI